MRISLLENWVNKDFSEDYYDQGLKALSSDECLKLLMRKNKFTEDNYDAENDDDNDNDNDDDCDDTEKSENEENENDDSDIDKESDDVENDDDDDVNDDDGSEECDEEVDNGEDLVSESSYSESYASDSYLKHSTKSSKKTNKSKDNKKLILKKKIDMKRKQLSNEIALFREKVTKEILKSNFEMSTSSFWKQNAKRLPNLYNLAITLLNIQASSAFVERFFSICGVICTKRNTNMTDDFLNHARNDESEYKYSKTIKQRI